MGDIGIYDLLLHKRDVSFSVLGLYVWLELGGYNVVSFVHPENRIPISLKMKIKEKVLYDKLAMLKVRVQQAIGEVIDGHVIKQDVYVSKQLNSEATMSIENENVVYAYGSPIGFRSLLNDKRVHGQLRNETFIFAAIGRSKVDEASGDIKSIFHAYSVGQIVWPFTEFNNFVIKN